MISKSWSTSKKRAALYRQAGQLAEFCLQLFPLLVVHSDDYGRLDGDPETVKLVCDPGSARPVSDFTMALEQMENIGLVRRYDVAGTAWLQIVKFDEHQPGLLSKRTPAKSPSAPTDTEFPGNSVLTQPNLTQPNKTKEKISAEPSSPPVSASPVFLMFPVIGVGAGEWPLDEAQVETWGGLFPGLDVPGECRKALAWILATPGRRKTSKGMAKFLVGWFTRTVDTRRGSVAAAAPVRREPEYQEWICRHSPRCPHRVACAVVSARPSRVSA